MKEQEKTTNQEHEKEGSAKIPRRFRERLKNN